MPSMPAHRSDRPGRTGFGCASMRGLREASGAEFLRSWDADRKLLKYRSCWSTDKRGSYGPAFRQLHLTCPHVLLAAVSRA